MSAGNLIIRTAERYGVDSDKLLSTLRETVFSGASTSELMALMIVAEKYGLNPFTREIYAFRSRGGGIVPVVGLDGWATLVTRHPSFDGMSFVYGPDVDHDGREVPSWIECSIHLKGSDHPVTVREYLDECYVPARGSSPGPWQTHTRRMLRHKAVIQCARIALGHSGIFDPDEAERIREGEEARERGKPIVAMPEAKTIPTTIEEESHEKS
jgi:phage recombination protein Bet